MGDIFYPEHPPVIPDGQCPPQETPTCKPGHFHHVDAPPPPPGKPGPGPCGVNPFIPQIAPVPPVPSPIEGSSLYESMGQMAERVNTCINAWNGISRNCYEALNQIVQAARSNDVYYDNCEVKYQTGYDEIEGATYAIVEKKAVDRKGNPIFVKLYPAFNNSTNPGVKQKIFDASFINSANVIMTAVQASDATWSGPAMINGAQIPGSEQEEGYVYGFTKRGALRYFKSDVVITTLCQQGMVDVIGGCVPLVYDGKVLDDIQNANSKMSVTAIGYNSGTGSVFFFSCSAQTEPGITLNGVARILTEFGCTVGVCTSATVNETTATTSEGMLYLGQMTTEPVQARQPENLAYWVVSKQCCFRNKFEKEIADLVQTTGRNAWQTYLLGVQIQEFDDRILANSLAIKEEQERAMQAEGWLQQNINSEVNRALQAEAWLQENINKEVERATAAETELREDLQAETDRATAAEVQLKNDLTAETIRATNAERVLQTNIDNEAAARIKADLDLLDAIEQETAARKQEDQNLLELIQRYNKQTNDKIDGINTTIDGINATINGIIGGEVELPYLKLTGGTLSGPVNMTNGSTVTVGRGPTSNLEVATKKYVDDAIAGGITPGGDVTKEYVDQQIGNVQDQLNGKVSKTGDTMSGSLNMAGNKIVDPVLSSNTPITLDNGTGGAGSITNMAEPTNDLDGANKKYVDEEISGAIANIEDSLSGKFLPIAGGNMTGDINMTGNSVLSFYDDITQTGSEILSRSGSVNGQQEMGSVYNDDTYIVVKSERGAVNLIGSEVNTSDGSGESIAINGVNKVKLTPGNDTGCSIQLSDTAIQLNSGIVYAGANGQRNGNVNAGAYNLYDGTGNLNSSIIQHNGHLDINVNDASGSVYVNRNGTAGGTGEVWLTEVHAPQELRLSPATNVNVLSHKITNLANGVNNNDAVNVSQLNSVKNMIGSGIPVSNITTIALTRTDTNYCNIRFGNTFETSRYMDMSINFNVQSGTIVTVNSIDTSVQGILKVNFTSNNNIAGPNITFGYVANKLIIQLQNMYVVNNEDKSYTSYRCETPLTYSVSGSIGNAGKDHTLWLPLFWWTYVN